jgi:hypothetical protein
MKVVLVSWLCFEFEEAGLSGRLCPGYRLITVKRATPHIITTTIRIIYITTDKTKVWKKDKDILLEASRHHHPSKV